MALPPANRTYVNLKVHFNQEYQLQNTIKTTRQAGYHQMNYVKGNEIETDSQSTLEETVQNFVAATAADREAFASPTNTNNQLHSQVEQLTTANATMQASLNAIQQQMAFMAVNPIPAMQPTQQQQQPPQMYGGCGNYGGRDRYYGGHNNPYNGRRGRGSRGRSYQSGYNQGRQQVPSFVPTPTTFQYNQQPPAPQEKYAQFTTTIGSSSQLKYTVPIKQSEPAKPIQMLQQL